jgi:hypothetical protein
MMVASFAQSRKHKEKKRHPYGQEKKSLQEGQHEPHDSEYEEKSRNN